MEKSKTKMGIKGCSLRRDRGTISNKVIREYVTKMWRWIKAIENESGIHLSEWSCAKNLRQEGARQIKEH